MSSRLAPGDLRRRHSYRPIVIDVDWNDRVICTSREECERAAVIRAKTTCKHSVTLIVFYCAECYKMVREGRASCRPCMDMHVAGIHMREWVEDL